MDRRLAPVETRLSYPENQGTIRTFGRAQGYPLNFGLKGACIGHKSAMAFILWILAVVLVVAGIVSLVRGQLLWGIVLIVVGLLVGPGGVSIFT
jgi:hypothetical protein